MGLPRWFVNCVWELGVHEADGVWTTQIWPVNLRPSSSVVFDYVASGDVEAVRELLRSGHLSVRDQAQDEYEDMSIFEVGNTHKTTQSHKQAYMYFFKMAVDSGQLELCRFLLNESSLFHRDEIVNMARTQLVRNTRLMKTDQRMVRYIEEVFDLLATVNGMDSDINLENLKALRGFYETVFASLVPLPLVTVPVASIPFAQRFTIIIQSSGWHPGFFANTFCGDEWNVFVTQADEEGKTALHWAAEHYGKSEIYGNLVTELIKQGSDAHACWSKRVSKFSPFMSFLRGAKYRRRKNAISLSDAVLRWGRVLIEAGQSLSKFAATETEFLRANFNGKFWLNGRAFFPVSLEVSGERRLSMRVQHVFQVRVWKATPLHVPGAWPACPALPGPPVWLPELPETICWDPEATDEQEGFRWILADTVSIKMDSYLVEPPGDSNMIKFDFPWYGDLRRAVLDDRDLPLATRIMDNGSGPYNRRRSASAPVVNRRPQVDVNRWNDIMHQCALSMRWETCSLIRTSLRACLQGRCRRQTRQPSLPYWSRSWEAELLEDERHVQVAKRFAQRFCPEHLEVAERTSARVEERAKLRMRPARPPKMF